MFRCTNDNIARQLAPARPRAPVLAYVLAAAATLLMAWASCAPSLTDWDSWNYTGEAIRAQPSALCLGRWWFIALMRWTFLALGSSANAIHGYVPMQIAVAVMTAAAVAALMHWTFLFTSQRKIAIAAGIVGAISPSLATYCSAVMTEGPTLLFLSLAMIGWEKTIQGAGTLPRNAYPSTLQARPQDSWIAPEGWAMLAGLAFGIASDMREPAGLLCVWPIVSCFLDRPAGRWRLLTLAAAGATFTLVFGVMMTWVWRPYLTPMLALREWTQYMEKEQALCHVNLFANLAFLLMHYVMAAPLAALACAGWVWLKLKGNKASAPQLDATIARRLTWLAVSTIPFALSTWYNPDLSFNYRLLLPLSWALAPLGGAALVQVVQHLRAGKQARARQWAVGVVALGFVGALFVARFVPFVDSARHQNHLFNTMMHLPDNALIIPGPGSPAAKFIHDMGARPRWNVLLTGFDWTGDSLTAMVKPHFRAGRHVFVNVDPKGWTRAGDYNPEWKALQDMVGRFGQKPAAGEFVELLP